MQHLTHSEDKTAQCSSIVAGFFLRYDKATAGKEKKRCVIFFPTVWGLRWCNFWQDFGHLVDFDKCF